MFRQTQSQRQVQKVLPQIIQRQSLLAIPTLTLEQLVRQELEQNPFLEELSDEKLETAEDEKTEIEEAESSKDEELDVDELIESDTEGFKTEDYNYSEIKSNIENLWRSKVSLQDNLLSQLHLSVLSDLEIFIGEEIIGNIDDEGYVKVDNQTLVQIINEQKSGTEYETDEITEQSIEKVIQVIQRFEPVGIASRDLKECLSIQVEFYSDDDDFNKITLKMINEYFEEFRRKNYEKLMRDLDTDIDTLNKIFDFVGKLNPKPGFIDETDIQQYIFPDLIVTRDNDEYKVELNERNVPSLRLNSAYKKLLTNKKNKVSKDTKEFITQNFERAKWFLDSINSRRHTMLKVMNSILSRQLEFFDNMGEGLKPMYEKDVAEDIKMDISTVSRTVRGKYVQTDFGIYELKHFFSNYMKNDEGDDVSTKEIKIKLKEIIDSEDPVNPFTDDDLTAEIQKAGFKIARRTIAKYRESLKIPKARLRRKL